MFQRLFGRERANRAIVDALVATSSRRSGSLLDRLTPRELEVLALVARGMTNAKIAEGLVLSERSIEKHINSILTKLDLPADSPVHRRVAATLVFLSEVGVGGANPARS